MIKPHRNQPLWWAFLIHRISGLTLVLFLPFHFYTLSLALNQPQTLNDFLHWSEMPLVKFSEFVLVLMLALHLFGGLRVLILENRPLTAHWQAKQKTLVAGVAAMGLFVALVFGLRSI